MEPTSIRVLVADDDPMVRAALTALIDGDPRLELVAAVPDASQAIRTAAAERPDVAVIDVRMPGSGVRAARGIRLHSPDTKILALSASDNRDTVLEMLESGAVGYLVKGSPVETIVESIVQAAAGKGSLSVEITGEVIEELVDQLGVRRRTRERERIQERRVRRALEKEDVLCVVFQPICSLEKRAAVGVEALARFKVRPTRGPEHWFNEAAKVGLRRELELAATRAAFDRLRDLPEGLYLSVNASPDTLSLPGFRKLLAGADGRRVVVELTEHARIDDYAPVNRALEQLRALGVRVAVDDAGAGFASLSHILRLEPDFIKLDRALIDGVERHRSHQALAAGLISFADKIDATIVAEGIERRAELDTLVGLGVGYGQGFYLARPARSMPRSSAASSVQ